MFFGAAALDDGSVILVGLTSGDWSRSNLGGYDFAVVKLNALGAEEWRLQVINLSYLPNWNSPSVADSLSTPTKWLSIVV